MLFAVAGCTVAVSASPSSAQPVNCPVGYFYVYGSGCVPASGAYSGFYGATPYNGLPPVYEPYGLAYGRGPIGPRGDRGFYNGRDGGFHGGVGGFHGGGGGFHGGGGGGFHGGGGGFHGGGGGGGHR